MSTPIIESDHANNLISIAQNDYTIDGKYLPEGIALIQAANHIEKLEAIIVAQRRHDASIGG